MVFLRLSLSRLNFSRRNMSPSFLHRDVSSFASSQGTNKPTTNRPTNSLACYPLNRVAVRFGYYHYKNVKSVYFTSRPFCFIFCPFGKFQFYCSSSPTDPCTEKKSTVPAYCTRKRLASQRAAQPLQPTRV